MLFFSFVYSPLLLKMEINEQHQKNKKKHNTLDQPPLVKIIMGEKAILKQWMAKCNA